LLDDRISRGCRLNARDQRTPTGRLRLNLIEERAEVFAVDAAERENRSYGHPKNELGGHASGQSLFRRGVDQARGRTETSASIEIRSGHAGLASREIRLY
jgi:hypothetical protein